MSSDWTISDVLDHLGAPSICKRGHFLETLLHKVLIVGEYLYVIDCAAVACTEKEQHLPAIETAEDTE